MEKDSFHDRIQIILIIAGAIALAVWMNNISNNRSDSKQKSGDRAKPKSETIKTYQNQVVRDSIQH